MPASVMMIDWLAEEKSIAVLSDEKISLADSEIKANALTALPMAPSQPTSGTIVPGVRVIVPHVDLVHSIGTDALKHATHHAVSCHRLVFGRVIGQRHYFWFVHKIWRVIKTLLY